MSDQKGSSSPYLPAIFHKAHAEAQKGITAPLSDAGATLVLYAVAPIVFKAIHLSIKPDELTRCLAQDSQTIFSVLLNCQEAAAVFSSLIEQNPYTRFRMGCTQKQDDDDDEKPDHPQGCFFIRISLVRSLSTEISLLFMYDYAEARSFPLARDHRSKCRILACTAPVANQRCSRCKSNKARYCGVAHQQADWRFHKRKCKEPK